MWAIASRTSAIEDSSWVKPHSVDLVQALTTPAEPAALPPDSAAHMDWLAFTETPGATTGNRDHGAILDATLALVGSIGYEATTTARIARLAEVNENAVFALYRTKLELFMDATLRQWQAGLRCNDAFASGIAARYGVGIAEAPCSARRNAVAGNGSDRSPWSSCDWGGISRTSAAALMPISWPMPRTADSMHQAYRQPSSALELSASSP